MLDSKNLQAATPVEIDTVLSDLFGAQYRIYDDLENNANWVMSQAGMHLPSTRTNRYTSTRPGTLDDALAALADKTDDNAQRLLAKRRDLFDALTANEAEQQPFKNEFARRGGWPRAYLVLNNNGHVHTSLYCGTCYPTTRYGWLIEMSGQDEATIVAAIGSDACTVCYPTSPAIGKRTTFHTSELEAQKAAAERQAIKDAKAAAKAAKAIANPDGSPLILSGSYRDHIETLAAAKMWLTDAAWWNTDRGYGAGHPDFTESKIAIVAAAVAHKNGTTPEAEIEAAAARARRRK